MPELPEVETIVRQVRPALVGRTIIRASLSHDNVLRGVTKRRLLRGLRGADIRDVARRAKHAIIDLGSHRLVIQPGMTGSLMVYDRRLSSDEARYAVLRAPLDDGTELVYRDVRRIGRIYLLDPAAYHAYSAGLGPEPLARSFDEAAFARALAGTRQAIKKAIMDQRRVAGIGNIYANEALFAARIDPSKPADALTRDQRTRLRREVRRILKAAVRSQGSTVRDYRTGTGQRGRFQLELVVYGRQDEPCVACGTRLTGTHAIDGRMTVFCHRCQT